MRYYGFGNMYLSSLQQGLQNAHTIVEMYNEYPQELHPEMFEFLNEWAIEHKTMILLNGGYSENLRELFRFFSDERNPYPFAKFNEGQDALDGALTCVGIILPQKIYEVAALIRRDFPKQGPGLLDIIRTNGQVTFYDDNTYGIHEDHNSITHKFTDWEIELMNELNKYGLAK